MFSTTKHAATVIAARGIRADWVAHVLQTPSRVEPDLTDPTLEHRLAPIPAFDFRVLRVVYRKQTVPPLVITAYFDRAMKGKL